MFLCVNAWMTWICKQLYVSVRKFLDYMDMQTIRCFCVNAWITWICKQLDIHVCKCLDYMAM